MRLRQNKTQLSKKQKYNITYRAHFLLFHLDFLCFTMLQLVPVFFYNMSHFFFCRNSIYLTLTFHHHFLTKIFSSDFLPKTLSGQNYFQKWNQTCSNQTNNLKMSLKNVFCLLQLGLLKCETIFETVWSKSPYSQESLKFQTNQYFL